MIPQNVVSDNTVTIWYCYCFIYWQHSSNVVSVSLCEHSWEKYCNKISSVLFIVHWIHSGTLRVWPASILVSFSGGTKPPPHLFTPQHSSLWTNYFCSKTGVLLLFRTEGSDQCDVSLVDWLILSWDTSKSTVISHAAGLEINDGSQSWVAFSVRDLTESCSEALSAASVSTCCWLSSRDSLRDWNSW